MHVSANLSQVEAAIYSTKEWGSTSVIPPVIKPRTTFRTFWVKVSPSILVLYLNDFIEAKNFYSRHLITL